MHIAYIDQLANNENGYLHKTSGIAKIFLTGSFIASIIIAKYLIELLLIFTVVTILIATNKLPVRKLLRFCLYPAFFSLLFALIKFTHSAEEGFAIILKAVDSALAAILLITTTPYTEIFSFFRLFLPDVVVGGMFFTYRIFFILLEKIENALAIIKLRGGFRPSNIIFNVKNLACILGVLFISAIDMSERMYNIYSLRGYGGSGIFLENKPYKLKKADYIPIGTGIVIFIMVVIL